MKIVTNYFEDRREALFDIIGPQMLADVIGYHAHRASIQRVLRAELERAAAGAAAGRSCPSRSASVASPWSTCSASGRTAPVEACVTVGSQAPLLYTFDAIPAMPYDEADPPHLAVPWLNIYDTRDFLSFLAEPLFRRSDGLASVVDLRVQSGKDFPKSHGAYWELGAGLGRDRDRVQLEADRAADRARGAPARLRGAQGAGPERARSRRLKTRPPNVPRSGGRGPSAVEVGGCCEQHPDDHPEGRDRMQGEPRTREPVDHHGPPPVRQPGYLREARGFASPPRDGFAIVDRSPPGRR